MYITKNGITDKLTQYECKNIPQVKSIINELTKTTSQNNDWKDICSLVKTSTADSVDYICFIDNTERECSVNIGYDISCKSYFVWIEI
jgi:hypothetical protein